MTFDVNRAIAFPWILLGVFWTITALRAKKAVRREPAAARWLHILFMAIVFALMFRSDARMGPLRQRVIPAPMAVSLIGIVLAWLGVALAIWARSALGSNWSGSVTVKENHTLIMRGPYRFVRHPIYAGMLLAMLGAALVYGAAGCFVAVILGYAAFWRKARKEEQFMTQEFGAEYRHYQTAVKQMIPFLL